VSYNGLGALKGWLRVMGLRAAIRAQRGTRSDEPEDVAEALADAASDPALQYQRRLYETEFRAAFSQAIAALTVRERNLLKQSVLYGATIDDLGALYRVHRATVARWLAAARERLADDTRRRMIAQLGIAPSDYDSIVHLIRSQLDVSMERLLG
jgi:RNA polymerase sigma-70 factor (ECF subfamily)